MSESQFPYFLPDEVALHNSHKDCWLSCLTGVYDLTEYVTRNYKTPISKYLIGHGGKDVSHWFDARFDIETDRRVARLKRYVEPATGNFRVLLPYNTPKPENVTSTWDCKPKCCRCYMPKDDSNYELTGSCWSELEWIFNGTEYQKGWLTKNPRPCKITNVLTGQQTTIRVCEEDSIERIRERALIFNRHGASYTWKFEGKPLNLALSLTENGIPDERDRYLAYGLPEDSTAYIPNLLCYYNDDLTEL